VGFPAFRLSFLLFCLFSISFPSALPQYRPKVESSVVPLLPVLFCPVQARLFQRGLSFRKRSTPLDSLSRHNSAYMEHDILAFYSISIEVFPSRAFLFLVIPSLVRESALAPECTYRVKLSLRGRKELSSPLSSCLRSASNARPSRPLLLVIGAHSDFLQVSDPLFPCSSSAGIFFLMRLFLSSLP